MIYEYLIDVKDDGAFKINMDYFLSGESMEKDFAQKHYSEKLIKLPACSVDYDSPKKTDINDSNYKREKNI